MKTLKSPQTLLAKLTAVSFIAWLDGRALLWKRPADTPEDPCAKRYAGHNSDSTIDSSTRRRYGLKPRGGSSAVVSVLHKERVGANHGKETAHNNEGGDQQTNNFGGCEPMHTARLWTTAGSYHLTRHKISCGYRERASSAAVGF